MSINPAIWPKASRWSKPRLLWRALPFSVKAFAVSAAFWLALLAAAWLPWAKTARDFRERRAERESLAPLRAEAERLRLTFPQIVVVHPAYVGKPVYWAVQVISTSSTRVDEHPAWRVIWTNPERVQDERIYRDKVLARVAAVDGEAVYLDYLGRP